MEFSDLVNWATIAGGAGAVVLTVGITQILKNIAVIDKIPTQLTSYVVAAIIMVLATIFTGHYEASELVLAVLNAVIVSLSSNGAYVAYKRVVKGDSNDRTEAGISN
jgi:hypothetical protein